ncbi:MAG: hypothetical protein QXI12_04150 [Candidatus Methanomethyliaceae archaeon]
MDDVIVLLPISGGDYAIIYQLAKSEKRSVNDFIYRCIIEKVERLQEEWKKTMTPQLQPGGESGESAEGKRKGR